MIKLSGGSCKVGGLESLGLHVGEQLIRNLCQHLPRQQLQLSNYNGFNSLCMIKLSGGSCKAGRLDILYYIQERSHLESLSTLPSSAVLAV
jgi:hypothetical protein